MKKEKAESIYRVGRVKTLQSITYEKLTLPVDEDIQKVIFLHFNAVTDFLIYMYQAAPCKSGLPRLLRRL
jgi:hypothetical protein